MQRFLLQFFLERKQASRQKFAHGLMEIFPQICHTYGNPCSYKSLECIWTLAEEILNIYFVSVIASNMLTKYKITVTPNNILIYSQCFD